MAVAHTAPMATRVSPTTISTVSNRVISQLLRMWRAPIVGAVSGHDRLEQFMNRFRGSFGVSSWQWKSLQNSHNSESELDGSPASPGCSSNTAYVLKTPLQNRRAHQVAKSAHVFCL